MHQVLLAIQQSWLAYEILKFTIVIEAALILTIGIGYIFSQSKKLTSHLPTRRDIIYKSIKLPLQTFVWFLCLKVMLIFAEGWPDFFINTLKLWVNETLEMAMLLSISWTVFRIMKETRLTYLEQHTICPKDEKFAYVNSIHKFGEIIVFTITLLMAMEILNIPISGILTIGGVGGAAFSIANREMIANFFSGFMIHLDRPFEVGDFIYSSDKSFSGRVERVGLRFTIIRGRDKRPMFVPNASFNSINFVNRSRMTHRRILQYLSLQITELKSVQPMLKEIHEFLYNHKDIDNKQEIRVHLIKGDSNMSSDLKGCFKDRALIFQVMAYTFEKQSCPFLEIQDNIMLEIANIIKAHHLEFSYINQKILLDRVETQDS